MWDFALFLFNLSSGFFGICRWCFALLFDAYVNGGLDYVWMKRNENEANGSNTEDSSKETRDDCFSVAPHRDIAIAQPIAMP